MPETSYEGSALFTCLLAASRAGVRDLNAANRVFMYQEEKALNRKQSQNCHMNSSCQAANKLVRRDQIGIRL
jgi:hypothetical protein